MLYIKIYLILASLNGDAKHCGLSMTKLGKYECGKKYPLLTTNDWYKNIKNTNTTTI